MRVPTIVMYHEIAADPGPYLGPLGIWVPPEVFETQVAHLAANYDVIDLDTLLGGHWPRRPLLITFDDGLRSTLEMAREVLRPRGLPSVAFLNPSIVRSGGPSLDQVIAAYHATFGAAALGRALGAEGPLAADAAIASVASAWHPDHRAAMRQRLAREIGDAAGPPPPVIDAAGVAELAACGVEVGNHTATHVHGRSLTPAEIEVEVVAAKAELEALSGRPVRSFAIPYGKSEDLTPPVLDALRRSGHAASFLVGGRINRWRPAPDVWFRVAMDGIGADAASLGRTLRRAPLRRTASALRQRLLGSLRGR